MIVRTKLIFVGVLLSLVCSGGLFAQDKVRIGYIGLSLSSLPLHTSESKTPTKINFVRTIMLRLSETENQQALIDLVTQLLGDFPCEADVGDLFEGNFLAGKLAEHL